MILRAKYFLLLIVGLTLTGTAFAQNLTPDSSAPVSKRPSVVAAPNGVPLVDIAKPNAQGLSHNLFREFSVGTQGAILNNSRQEAARSVLGGIVPGNPNLKNGAASVILNEVTGVSRSQLNGYLEVHGQRADVIVANPNGITCNGCGFINTPRATLTTGIPELDGNGNLTGFRVENGDVTFGNLGANFSDIDIVDVLSRKIYINGRIDAKTLRLIAGHNRVNYNDVENPTELSSSTSNEIVIDSSLLGGMYVERLSIVANNKGTGVHMRGDMASSVGDISLRADGSIIVGRVSSGRKLTIRSANKTVTGKVIGAAGAVDVRANENITLDAVYSDETIDLDSTLGGVTVSGDISAIGNITISGLNDLMLNLVESNQNITLTSDAGNISLTQSLADGDTSITAQGTVTGQDIVTGGNLLQITSGGNITLTGLLASAGDLTVTSTSGSIEADYILSDNNMMVTAQNGVKAIEDIISLGTMDVTATSGDIDAKNISATGNMGLSAQNLLVTGDVTGESDITITTVSKTDVDGDITTENGDIKISAGTSIEYNRLSAGRDAILSSGTSNVSLENETIAGRNLELLTTADILNWQNKTYNLRAGNLVTITAKNANLSGGDFTFGNVLFSIENDLNLSEATVKSDFSTGTDITVTTKSLTHTSSSELVAGGNLYLTLSQSFTNRMVIGAFGDTVMKVEGDLTNIETGLIGASNHVGLFVIGTVTNKDGAALWATNGDLIIAGSDDGITHLAGGGFLLPGDLNNLVKNVKVLNSSAVIEAGRDIVIATGEFVNKRTTFATKSISSGGNQIVGYYNTNLYSPNFVGQDNTTLLDRCDWCPSFDNIIYRSHFNYTSYVFLPLFDASDFNYDSDPILETDWIMISALYDADADQDANHIDNFGGLRWGRIKSNGRVIDTENSTAEGRLTSGQNLSIISASDITNEYSQITAQGDIFLKGINLNNTGESFSQSRSVEFAYVDTPRKGYQDAQLRFYGAEAADLNSKTPVRLEEQSSFYFSITQASEDGGVSGKIEAGGTFTGTFDNAINNTNVAEGVAPNNDNLDRSFGGETTLTLLAPLQNQPLDLKSGEKQLDSLGTLNNLAGSSSLFQNSSDPTFVFETRAPFIDVNKFYGSAYFIDRIGYHPETQVKFLGDAFFETRLIEQAILNKTGKRLLDSNYQDASGQLKSLIDNGATTQKDLDLTVGIALTGNQINKLTKDIVWYVERVVNGQKVLVPEVYLSNRTTFDFANDGAIIHGKTVNLTSRNDINNRGGRVSSEQDLSIRSTEGTINLAAVSKSYDLGEGRKREILGRRAKFTAGGSLTLLAEKDINIVGSTVSSGEDLILGAGDNIGLTSRSLTNEALKFGRKGYRQEVWRKDQVLSDLTSGGDTTILAESGNLAIEGATVVADGRADLAAGKEVSIAAAEEKQGYDIRHKHGFKKQDTRTLRENSVAAGKDLTIKSGEDTSVKASEIIAGGKEEGDLTIIAGGKVKIESDEETFDSDEYYKKKGFLKKKERRETIHDERTVSSRVGASGDVNIIAEDDVDIKASHLDAGKDLRIAAGTKLNDNNELTASGKDANVNITTNREDDSYYKYEKSSGLMGSSSQGSFFFGYKKEKHIIDTKTATHALASLSAGQSVVVTATKDIDANAPLIAANDNIELTAGRDVSIKSVQDLFDHHEYHKVSQFGVTVSVFENVTSSFKALTDFNTGKGSGGAKAISTISAGLRAIDAVNTLTGGHLAGVNIGIGFSSSKSTLDQTYKTAKTGVLQAGQDVKIEAGRDINTEGTAILAGRDVELDAGRDLNLKAAESTTEEKSSSKSSSLGASVTVGVGLKGVGVSAGVNGSVSKSNSEGESKSYTNTKIVAGNEAKLNSGRDTVLEGARVEADSIIATVGRDLTIESLQNTSKYKSSSKGASFGLSTSLGGYSTGINITPDNLLNNALKNGDGQPIYNPNGVGGYGLLGDGKIGGSSWNIGINGSKGEGEFAWVQEQSGLVGEGKVDVTVGENTDLKGGIIASKSKELTLDTGTLTFSDLADKDKSKNIGGSISVGGPLSGGGNESEGKIGGSGDLSVTVEGQYAKKDKEGVTRATVGEGEITIRDEAKQKELEESGKTQKLSNLNRDLDKAQEVTKDEETEINLYVSDTSIRTAFKVVEVVGKTASEVVSSVLNELSQTENSRALGELSEVVGKQISAEEVLQQLAACGGGSQGFNWHDVLFTKAYAQSGSCPIKIPGTDKIIYLSKEETHQCGVVLTQYILANLAGYTTPGRALRKAGLIAALAKGAYDDVSALGELGKHIYNVSALDKSSSKYKASKAVLDGISEGVKWAANNPNKFLSSVGESQKQFFISKFEEYHQALARGDLVAAGYAEGEIFFRISEIASVIALPATAPKAVVGAVKLAKNAGSAVKNIFKGGFKPYKTKSVEFDIRVKTYPNSDVVELKILGTPKPFRSADLRGTYKNGDLKIHAYGTDVKGRKIGTELVSTAIEKIGASKVKTISGVFGIDNKKVYNGLISSGSSPVNAAWGTPLGKTMRELGFNKVEIKPGDLPGFKFGFK
ncbi:MAG: hemagglutinin repeat-containing protein [Hyphomicrobiales bacterium]